MALGLLMLFAAPAGGTIDARGVSSDPGQFSRILDDASAFTTGPGLESSGTALPIEQDEDSILLGSAQSTLATISSGSARDGEQLIDLGDLLALPALQAAEMIRSSLILEEAHEVYDTTSAPRPPAGPDRQAAIFLEAQEPIALRGPASARRDVTGKDELRR
jgi:hypothetical protein